MSIINANAIADCICIEISPSDILMRLFVMMFVRLALAGRL